MGSLMAYYVSCSACEYEDRMETVTEILERQAEHRAEHSYEHVLEFEVE